MEYTLTREQLEAKRTELASSGVVLTGDSGTINHSDVELSFAYVEPTLTVEIIHKPWAISKSFVQNKIDAWFKS